MLKSKAEFDKAQELAEAGRHADVVTYLSSWSRAELEESPTLSLLFGTAQARLGRHDNGTQWVELALRRARELGERAIETRALNARGAIAFVTGAIDEGADYLTQALMAASRDGDHATIGRCSNNLGIINNIRGRHAEAIGSYKMALAAFQRAGLRHGIAEAHHNLGITYKEQGEFNRALREAKLANDEAIAAGDHALAALTVRGRAEIRVLRNEHEIAQQEIERALKTHRGLGDAVQETEDLRTLAVVLAARGQLETAEETLRDVMMRADQHNRPQISADATRDLAYVLRKVGREDEALDAARAAISGFEQLGAEAEIRKLDSAEWGYPLGKELRQALEPLTEAQRLADSGQYTKLVSYLEKRPAEELERSPTMALLNGIGHARVGRLDEGRHWVAIALTRARVLGDRAIEVRALNTHGVITLELGGLDEAREFFRRAQTEATRDGDLATVGRCANNLGIVANMEGDYGQAVSAYAMAIAAYEHAGSDRGVVESQHNLGIAHRERGDLSEALRAADQAVEAAEVLGDSALTAQALAGRAEIRVARQEPELAFREATQAMEMHRELKDGVRVSEDLRILAGALAADGQFDDAEAMLRDVVQRAIEQSRPLLVATAQRDLAFLLSGRGRNAEARDIANKARDLFARLGARIQIEKLDEFLEESARSAA